MPLKEVKAILKNLKIGMYFYLIADGHRTVRFITANGATLHYLTGTGNVRKVGIEYIKAIKVLNTESANVQLLTDEQIEVQAKERTSFPIMCYPNKAIESGCKAKYIEGAKWVREMVATGGISYLEFVVPLPRSEEEIKEILKNKKQALYEICKQTEYVKVGRSWRQGTPKTK
jgi:hypothetical protein